MKLHLYAGLCAAALLTTPALAQGTDAPQNPPPAVTAPAPVQPPQGTSPQAAPSPPPGEQQSTAPAAAAPGTQQAAISGARGRPANLCHELVAFLTPKPAPGSAPAPGTQSAAGGQQAQPAAPPANAAQAPAGASGNTAPAAAGAQGPTSGSGSGAAGPQGADAPAVEATKSPQPKNDTAPERSGMPAPIPADQAATPTKPDDLTQAQGFAEANDFRGCKEMAQRLRVAGTALPPAVIALAGLPVETLERSRMP